MTAIAAVLDCPSLVEEKASHGVSEAHEKVRRMIRKASDHVSQTFSLGLAPHVFPALRDIWQNCSEKGWNGYSASPVRSAALNEAVHYCMQFPSRRIPEVYADPAGGVIFEWRQRDDSFFLLNLTGTGTLVYAGVFGGGELHGVSKATAVLPNNIREIIATHFS